LVGITGSSQRLGFVNSSARYRASGDQAFAPTRWIRNRSSGRNNRDEACRAERSAARAATAAAMKRLRRTRLLSQWQNSASRRQVRPPATASETQLRRPRCRMRGPSGLWRIIRAHLAPAPRNVRLAAHLIVRCESTSYFILCQLAWMATILAVGQR
jgi:hypothetical protein